MKKILLKILFVILLFIVSVVIGVYSIFLREGVAYPGVLKISQGLGIFIGFILIFLLYGFSMVLLRKKLGWAVITIVVLIPLLFFLISKGINSSSKYSLKLLPYYLSVILALVSGYLFSVRSKKKLMIPALLALFPLLMSFGIYDLWVHKIEYGTFYGDVSDGKIVTFEMTNKAGEIVDNDALMDKFVLFDFWYRTCGPCWVKFPDLQRIHEKYKNHPEVEVYAVNRPMDWDKPGQLYTSVEKKEYTFPVLAGTQEIMDAFDVYVYPTVVLLDKNGAVIFMGELDDGEIKLEELLETES